MGTPLISAINGMPAMAGSMPTGPARSGANMLVDPATGQPPVFNTGVTGNPPGNVPQPKLFAPGQQIHNRLVSPSQYSLFNSSQTQPGDAQNYFQQLHSNFSGIQEAMRQLEQLYNYHQQQNTNYNMNNQGLGKGGTGQAYGNTQYIGQQPSFNAGPNSGMI